MDEPKFTRWEVRPDGSLVPGPQMSFANYGLAYTAVGVQNVPFITDTKAYLFADTGEIIVWNPSDMTVTRTTDLGLENRGGLAPSPGSGMLLRGNRVLMAVRWKSADSTQFGDSIRLIEVDTTTDTIVNRVDSPLCDDAFVRALAPDGSAYFSNHPYRAALRRLRGATYGSRVCALRVASSDSAFDAAFNPDLRALAGGREAGQLVPLSDAVAAFRTFYPEEAGDPAEYEFSTPAYRWWRWEIGSSTASVIPEQALSGAGAGIHYDGTRVYVTTSSADFASTTLTELTANAALRPGLEVRGSFHGFVRLR